MSLSPRMAASLATTSELATGAARLFFDRRLSKVEIASRLRTSRFRVARLIESALAKGLVRIEYRDVPLEDGGWPGPWKTILGSTCARWPRCRTKPDRRAGALGAWPAWAGGGARWPHRPGRRHRHRLGFDPGRGRARDRPAGGDPSIAVVQLAGSSSQLGRELDAGDLSRLLADRLGAGAPRHRSRRPSSSRRPCARPSLASPTWPRPRRRVPGIASRRGDRRHRRHAQRRPGSRARRSFGRVSWTELRSSPPA